MQWETPLALTVFNIISITPYSVFTILQRLFTYRKQKFIFQRIINEITEKVPCISLCTYTGGERKNCSWQSKGASMIR